MATITADVGPTDEVETFDVPTASGHVAGIRVDDVRVYLGGYAGDRDAAIVASCDLLIGKLTELRDAAAGRIWDAEHAAIDDASPAQGHEVVAEWTRPEAATA